VNEFVDECRREWRRLGVPDPIASEMAADLSADLDEAQAEGGSPEDVLGNSAFDPRRFAAAWATARGVTGPPIPESPSRRRSRVAVALTVLLAVLIVGAGLVLLVGSRGRSFAVAARRIIAVPGPISVFGPHNARIFQGGTPGPPFVGTQVVGVDLYTLAWLLLIVGVAGLGLLAFLYWSPRFGFRRHSRLLGRRPQTWA